MPQASKTVLLERFTEFVKVREERLNKLESIGTTRKEAQPLPELAGLFRIPLEIRWQIYRYCIPRKRIVEVSFPRFSIGWTSQEDGMSDFEEVRDSPDTDSEENMREFEEDNTQSPESNAPALSIDLWNIYEKNNSLFLTSRQISEEALDFLYGENIFKLCLNGEGEYFLRKNFSERNRQRLRYILVTAQPMGVSFGQAHLPHEALWSSVLPNIRILRLVAQQPFGAAVYYNAPTLELEMDRWLHWIRPFLECFNRHLRNTSVAEVDDDDRKETSDLIKESLKIGYRRVRCRLAGNLIFRRGPFSLESGYWDEDEPINCRDIFSDCNSD